MNLAPKNISSVIAVQSRTCRSRHARNFARVIKKRIVTAMAPSVYIFAASLKSFAYSEPGPKKVWKYPVASSNIPTASMPINAASARSHFLSAKPARISPCIPAPASIEQHSTLTASQIIGLTCRKESQKANIVAIAKMSITPYRRAARSIEEPIISAAIGI